MPSPDEQAIKENTKNTLIDLKISGVPMTLQDRPSPTNSRPNSRSEYLRRPMSATPTLCFQDKGVKWRGLSPKRQKPVRNKSTGGRLKPGLASKPPLPPAAYINHSSTPPPTRHRSFDDIVNMKFQRWFPESVVTNLGLNPSGMNDADLVAGRKSVESSTDEISRADSRMSSDVEIDNEDNRRILPAIEYRPESQRSDVTFKVEEINENKSIITKAEQEISSKSIEKQYGTGKKTSWDEEKHNSKIQSWVDELPEEKSWYGIPADFAQRPQTKKEFWPEEKPSSGKTESIGSIRNNWADDKSGWSGDTPRWNEIKQTLQNDSWQHKKPNDIVDKVADKSNSCKNTDCRGTQIDSSQNNWTCQDSWLSAYEWKDTKQETQNINLHEHDKNNKENDNISEKAEDENSKEEDNWKDINRLKGTECWVENDPEPKENVSNIPISSDTEFKTQEILTWIGGTSAAKKFQRQGESTYDELISMIKTIEHEENESIKLELLSLGRSAANSVCSNPVGSRDIMMFLDEVDTHDEDIPQRKPALNNGETELAKRCCELSALARERKKALDALNRQISELKAKLEKQNADTLSAAKRNQTLMQQIVKEKELMGEQCASLIQQMESRHAAKIHELEERHSIDLKTQESKLLAAEKIRQEKWVNQKTKKIKELTVKGMETELERLTSIHQEEVKELRRCHEKEISDIETACQRRLQTARDHFLRDREIAIQAERDAANAQVEEERSNLERKLSEEKRKLTTTLREEKARLEHEIEETLTMRNAELEEKWARAGRALDEKLADITKQHQREIAMLEEKIKETRDAVLREAEAASVEREHIIREECHKERDRHISAVIARLDKEALDKEKHLDVRMMRLKTEHEQEIKELEDALSDSRRKISDYRLQMDAMEAAVRESETRTASAKAEAAAARAEGERVATHRSEAELAALNRELAAARERADAAVSASNRSVQQELATVYIRVKDAVSKKEEQIKALKEQRDLALERCSQLEAALSACTTL